MSRENVEVVRQIFDAVARRDTDAVLSLYDPDVEMDASHSEFAVFLGPSVYRGHEEAFEASIALGARRSRTSRPSVRN